MTWTRCLAWLAIALLVPGSLAHAANAAAAWWGIAWPDVIIAIEGSIRTATSVMFIGWFFLCYRQARREHPDRMRWRSAWAIAGFLIPGVGIVVPYLLTRDLWRSTISNSLGLPRLWWTAFTAGNVLWMAGAGIPDVMYTWPRALPVTREGFWALSGAFSIVLIRSIMNAGTRSR